MSFSKLIQKHSVTFQKKTFQPFEIEFLEPRLYNINCIKLISYNEENCLTVYRGVDVNTNEIYSVYEWKYVLEKNKIFEKKKLELCQAEVKRIKLIHFMEYFFTYVLLALKKKDAQV